jgi:RNA-binding protein YhbY
MMTFTTAKLTELPLRTTSTLPLSSHSLLSKIATFQSLKKPFSTATSSSLRTNKTPKTQQKNPNWISKWKPSQNHSIKNPPSEVSQEKPHYFSNDKGQNAIERIVLRLRNLGLGSDDEDELEGLEGSEINGGGLTGEERLGDLLKREWVRPDTVVFSNDEGSDSDESVLPWEREERGAVEMEGGIESGRKRRGKAPTLAELTIEDEELRRLRRMGMFIRERISIPKAGITNAVLENIHDRWRKEELVRLKFHEVLAHDMKTAHEIVEVNF